VVQNIINILNKLLSEISKGREYDKFVSNDGIKNNTIEFPMKIQLIGNLSLSYINTNYFPFFYRRHFFLAKFFLHQLCVILFIQFIKCIITIIIRFPLSNNISIFIFFFKIIITLYII
jgi:hypothetical protein